MVCNFSFFFTSVKENIFYQRIVCRDLDRVTLGLRLRLALGLQLPWRRFALSQCFMFSLLLFSFLNFLFAFEYMFNIWRHELNYAGEKLNARLVTQYVHCAVHVQTGFTISFINIFGSDCTLAVTYRHHLLTWFSHPLHNTQKNTTIHSVSKKLEPGNLNQRSLRVIESVTIR